MRVCAVFPSRISVGTNLQSGAALFHLFPLAGVCGCNALRAQALFWPCHFDPHRPYQ